MRQTSYPVKTIRKTESGDGLAWDAMIRDARKRIEDLNYSIKVFEKKKAAGEICPVKQSDCQTETAAT